MHEKIHEIMKIKQKEGQNSHTGLKEENLAKIEEENDKKCDVQPCQVGERRKV